MNYIQNKWNNDMNNDTENNTTDSEYEDDEYIQNDIAPEPLNQDFVKNVLKAKHSLYDNIVLAPEPGTQNAQNLQLLNEYLKKVNKVYVLAVNAQKGEINEESMKTFPPASRESILFVLKWLKEYFSKNRIPDTIPYSDFINKSFHEYQFVQNDEFE